ncbi:acyl-CoA thioesterase [Emydomyces testavorans]|uniref:Acyl-CoA thioesterase n=1 Tax=Emydomyces testavorans TaxID=2070801 RepID=A0AAF0IFQ9_9EURO|nr:acyl-CoA thioesterase [Emydomyces testavorans]
MGVTLFEPPPRDPSKSAIENILDLTPVTDIGPDVFTNTRPLWHPPGARGIYGGSAIAQCLAAAQLTVPSDYLPHSMHCYFVLAGDSSLPILYHVERVRDGKSFATRTVQARQRGRPIFTTTLSFDREGSGGEHKVEHATPMPKNLQFPDEKDESPGRGPFESRRSHVADSSASSRPEEKVILQWIRARGKISEAGGLQAHLSALAYMSDSYFIGTVARVQNLPRFSSPAALKKALSALKNPSDLDEQTITKYLKDLADKEAHELKSHAAGTTNSRSRVAPKREIGMMVSLDHTIYFHNRRGFRADNWIFTEMASPWAGEGRGLVTQKMWARDGTLIATCVQEGVVRLKQDRPVNGSKL